jgi:hypothetical protein
VRGSIVTLALFACVGVACEEPQISPLDSGADTAAPASDAQDDVETEDTGPEDSGGPPFIWVTTATTLYQFDPSGFVLTKIAELSCGAEQVQDIAVDRDGHMFGATLESLVRIDPGTGECTRVAKGSYPRSLAFVPAGVLDPDHEILVGYVYGQYQRIDTKTGAVTFAGALYPNPLGYPLEASGDLVVLKDGKAYLTAVIPNPAVNDVIVQIDPLTGQAKRLAGPTNRPSLAGLGAYGAWLYAFAASGRIYRIAPINASTTELMYQGGDAGLIDGGVGLAFTGAAVPSNMP